MIQLIVWLTDVFATVMLLFAPVTIAAEAGDITVSEANEVCVKCHEKQNRALYMEWERSRHARAGE